MKNIAKNILELVLILCVALSAAACGNQQPSPAPAQQESQVLKTFTYITSVDPMISWESGGELGGRNQGFVQCL